MLSESWRCAPEDGTNANAATVKLNLWDPAAAESLPGHLSATSKHSRQLLVGSPCLHCCNTKPSLPRTSLPSNLRNQHCNRMVWRTSHSRRLDSGSPCRGLCNTIRLQCWFRKLDGRLVRGKE